MEIEYDPETAVTTFIRDEVSWVDHIMNLLCTTATLSTSTSCEGRRSLVVCVSHSPARTSVLLNLNNKIKYITKVDTVVPLFLMPCIKRSAISFDGVDEEILCY